MGMIKSVLIANRGEIACRVIRTCRRLGIKAIAIYSDADANALHVALADEVLRVGGAPARESYLDIAAVIAAAEAIHPGYGFLSENPDFAAACAAVGLIFIGPPAAAIRAMGSKSAAKALMEKAGVPILPGYHGHAQDLATFREAADRTGYPILIKPVAGGGGKGMHVVTAADDLEAALDRARREASSSFGDNRLLIERYVERPRHIEVQIFADAQGEVVHLFERDCSVQRRHQKVVEEAPAPGVSAEVRRNLGAAAIAAARAVHYVGAGTVEFLLGPGEEFWFMEMNTRLQVEHPVTEAITGLDLVEWQLRVAAGEALPLSQDRISVRGHAIEARIYAEDPAAEFRPAPGPLVHLRLPPERSDLRIDTGVREGDEIGIHYDPLIAKLIVHGADRSQAIERLRAALAESEIVGTATNVEFLAAIAVHPEFADRRCDTGFVDRNRAGLVSNSASASPIEFAAATLAVLCQRETMIVARTRRSHEPHSPWNDMSGWQLNDAPYQEVIWQLGDARRRVIVRGAALETELTIDNTKIIAREVRLDHRRLEATIEGRVMATTVVLDGPRATLFLDGHRRDFESFDPISRAAARPPDPGVLTASMPGLVTSVAAAAGGRVTRGTVLMTIEAMKVVHAIRAPADGVVDAIRFKIGDRVVENDVLVDFTVDTESVAP